MDFVKFSYTEKDRKGKLTEKEIGIRKSDVIFVFKEGENCTRLKVRGEQKKVVYKVDVNEPIDLVLEKMNYNSVFYKRKRYEESEEE